MSDDKEQDPEPSLSPRATRVIERVFKRPVEKFVQRAATDVPPQTAIQRMERDIDNAGVTSRDVAAFFAEVMSAMKHAPTGSHAAPAPREPKSAIETRAFQLFDSLDAVLPYGSAALLTCSYGIGTARHAEAVYEAVRLGNAVATARGERAAIELKAYAWHVLENLYGPFLHVLLQAVWARDGREYKPFTSIGDAVNEVKQRNLLGDQLWFDAVRIRNATAHREGWRPNLDRKTVVLQDQRKNGLGTWKAEFSVADLLGLLSQAVDITTVLETVLERAFRRDLLPELEPAFITFAKSGDEAPLAAANASYEEKFKGTWGALVSRGWKHVLPASSDPNPGGEVVPQ